MNAMEAHVLLTVAGLVDARASRLGADRAEAWAEILSDVSLDEAREALKEHLRESTVTVLPAHILMIVRRRRHDAAVREDARLVLEDRPAGPVVPMPDGLRRQLMEDRKRAKARKGLLKGPTPSRAIPKVDPEFQRRRAEAEAELRALGETRKERES